VLRIEDTDQERSTKESLQAILDGLTWLGIDWDEGPGKDGGHGPYFQMQKLAHYAATAQKLIDSGWAYRDYSTEDELAAARKAFAAEKGLKEGDDLRSAGFKFTSPWRDRKDGPTDKPALIRFKMPRREGRFGFDDLVLGRIEKPYDDFDDFVLMRSDGVPLYNFGCVVDDHDMEITHVARGQEHINSTFPQLMIYEALGWKPPTFAHIPLIFAQDNSKLSKRKHPEADVMRHKANGVLPHALINFIARLGWSHGNDELFTRDELIQKFDFSGVGKSQGVWNPSKLTATNQHWLKTMEPLQVAMTLLPYLHAAGATDAAVDAKLELGVCAFAERSTTLVEMAEKLKPYYAKGVTIDGAAAAKHLTPEGKALLQKARHELAALTEWTTAAIDPIVKVVADANAVKAGAVAQPIRVAATGGTASPGIGLTLELLGRDETLHRLDAALK
jgi:glutamyl-tRNA synthetase